jgi:urease accessory protein
MINNTALIHLLHLVSPTLPIGSFSYSQGLEWAVEAGWIDNLTDLQEWLIDLAECSLAQVDIPILQRMMTATSQKNVREFERLCSLLLACRETHELRAEELTRGKALATLLRNLRISCSTAMANELNRCQLAGFAFAAVQWEIPQTEAALGYTWAWLENQIITGMKIIPLGQTDGQRLLLKLGKRLPGIVEQALNVQLSDIGGANPAFSIASCLHETQYTRLYRS